MSRFLPNWLPPSAEVNRPTAEKVNELKANEQTVTVSGYNEPVPFVYGEQQLSGPILTVPKMHNNNLVYAVALCRIQEGKAIGGFTGLLINGVEQVAPPSIATNPATFNREGYSFRIYDGTQSTPDATLRAVFGTEFNDVFSQTAYAVISVPVAREADFNFGSSVVWIIKGRQCFDPRNSTWGWTENPSLHLRDFITCEAYGLGRDAIGIESCADWNDSLYSGLPRARTGLVLNDAMLEADCLDLLSMYAEALWSYEGDAIRLIPDAPASAIHPVSKDRIRDGTFEISGAGIGDTPTALNVIYSDRSRPAEWGSIPAHVQSEAHEDYGSSATQSDLQLPGVYRTIEADRRAWSRFQRLQTVGKISFQMFDDGVLYQVGDVLEVPDYMGLRSVLVRVTAQVEAVDLGVYQIHGEVYKKDFYPEGEDGAVVPDNALILYSNNTTPDNYTQHYSAEDIPITGGSTNSVEAAVNAPTGAVSVNLHAEGGHSGQADTSISLWVYPDPSGQRVTGYMGSSEGTSKHTHTASVNLTNRFNGLFKVERQTLRLLKRDSLATGSASPPVGTVFLSTKPLSAEGVLQFETSGRALKVGAAVKKQPADNGPSGTYSSWYGLHGHQANASYWNPEMPVIATSGPYSYLTLLEAAGGHGHEVHGCSVIYQRLKSRSIFAYQVVQPDALLPKGAIIAIDGPVPTGWVLCDGSNGTENLNDYFLLGSKTQNDSEILDDINEIKISGLGGSSFAGSHSHGTIKHYGRWEGVSTMAGAHSGSAGRHSHSTSTTPDQIFAFKPKRYSLKFIQFKGV